MLNEIRGLYGKIVITIVPSYTKKYHWHCYLCNTDSNKNVVFSGIALDCGDTYNVSHTQSENLDLNICCQEKMFKIGFTMYNSASQNAYH